MIITEIKGGLGNQMFQYALARCLAYRNQDEFMMDVVGYETDPLRQYLLNRLKVIEKFAPRELVRWYRWRKGRKAFLTWFVKPSVSLQLVKGGTNPCTFNPEIMSMKGNLYLGGFWQNYRYFQEIRDVLLQEFLPKSLSSAAMDIKAQIDSAENPVSVHVRRTDYVTAGKNQGLGTCEPEYYQAADKLVHGRTARPSYFIFSDDLKWTKENIRLNGPMTHVEGCAAHEDLHLMSLCRHNIIANSSFSFWGSWLNAHSDKIVISPQTWFRNPHVMASELVPKEWILI